MTTTYQPPDGGRRHVSAKAWTEEPAPPGYAGDYISGFRVSPGDLFFIVCRLSTWEQNEDREAARRKLEAHARRLRRAIKSQGGRVVKVFQVIASGKAPQEWLPEIARQAKACGAKLLALTADRFVRNREYKGGDTKWRPTDQSLEALKDTTEGVELMTFLDPDASPRECRSLLTKLGMEASLRRGGRPRKPPAVDRERGHRKRRNEEWRPYAREMRRRGASIRFITKRLRKLTGGTISRSTVYAWVDRESKKLATRKV